MSNSRDKQSHACIGFSFLSGESIKEVSTDNRPVFPGPFEKLHVLQ